MKPLRTLAIALCGGGAAALAADHGSPRPWHRVEGIGWQIQLGNAEDPALTDAREGTRGSCAPGMVAIEGEAHEGANDAVESAQDAACAEWNPKTFPGRCIRFDRARWPLAGPTHRMRFCIDRFEYPNRGGAYPIVAVTYPEARGLCARAGKRLCTEDEWTFACEGPDAWPYPYGFVRDDGACVVDGSNPAYDPIALGDRASPRYGAELDRLWRGEPSGSRAQCRSPFGVYDLTGNVDEWTTSTRSGGLRSILKGGYWGRVRTRCRPSTRAHGESFAFYQQGFRCCAAMPE